MTEKKFDDRFNDKEDGNAIDSWSAWRNIPKPALFFIAAVLVIIVVAIATMSNDGPNTSAAPVTSSQPATAAYAVPTAKPTTTVPPETAAPLNVETAVGKFAVTMLDTTITNELKSTYTHDKTADQFVVVKLTIKNNDDKARDVSTSMFELLDGNGKSYKALEKSVSIEGDEVLFYETINPGLSRTRLVVFETPTGISGLQIRADSGVALAGGKYVKFDLGK